MKLGKKSGALVSVLSLAAVLFYALHESERTSPGPLSPAHAAVADLEGRDGCDRCHGEDALPVADTCNDCHEPIAESMAAGRGLHGALAAGEADRCGACHVEHHGDRAPLVADTSFAQAGYESRARYDHANLDFPLTGRHADLACEECHENADVPFVAEGQSRFLGLSAACATCHEDPHEGRYGTSCGKCHGQTAAFDEAAAFRHTEAFPLVDGHAGLDCERCHEPSGPTSVATLAAATGSPVRSCATCHEDPHGAGGDAIFLPGAAACDECHTPARFEGTEYGPAEHARIGAPLDGAHAKAECADCHAPSKLPARPAPAAAIAACASCHENPHVAGTETAPVLESTACADCHSPADFRPATVASADHARFSIALDGPHGELGCAECHATAAAPARSKGSLPGALAECIACHENPHGERFLAVVGTETKTAPSATCADCHAAADPAFLAPPARMETALHTAAAFPLVPPHADLDCAECHEPAKSFAARFPGRTADDCAACHEDPHRGEFANGPFADATCLRCHRAEEFVPSKFTPEMHADAPFALTGAHAAVACIRCHEKGDDGRLVAGALAGVPDECAKCHEDPHGGTFDRPGLPAVVNGQTGCERCHGTTSFSPTTLPRFDHGFWTGERLLGPHAEAECRKCHRPPEGTVGRTFGPSPTRCDECHADPHLGQFRRSGRTDCARCHREEGPTFETVDFDHNRDSRFALDGRHAKLACSACHRRETTTDGRSAVRYRPLGTRCADCHLPGFRGK